ncbi:MAG: hypothetical protein QN545_04485 [Nitrososphaeraceae archaeon]|nr:hypothetical protein [Nitrososphaeraceae archaeon]
MIEISKQYKSVIMAALKHACEINDVVLNWKKIKKITILVVMAGISIGLSSMTSL